MYFSLPLNYIDFPKNHVRKQDFAEKLRDFP